MIDLPSFSAIVEGNPMCPVEKPELQRQLQSALNLADDQFAHYASDLYVFASEPVRKWLKENYKFYSNISTFRDQVTGKLMLDIPFAGFWKS